MITTVWELANLAKDAGRKIDPTLMKNLAVLSLAGSGEVEITGFADGRLQSVNTAAGRTAVTRQALAEMREEVAFKLIRQQVIKSCWISASGKSGLAIQITANRSTVNDVTYDVYEVSRTDAYGRWWAIRETESDGELKLWSRHAVQSNNADEAAWHHCLSMANRDKNAP